MKKLINKLNSLFVRGKVEGEHLLRNERGDTNFISIAIIMVVVIAVAVVFIAFKDEILGLFNSKTDELMGALS